MNEPQQSDKLAVELYQKSCNLGNGQGCNNVGGMYERVSITNSPSAW